ncbi:LysR family transcriptional regulator [Pseudomonas agarici]|nr:LysR family transcriptional regulator [Pseudomonas agarici]NWB92158.1 LysR family transcriptional regulator [Pseudomonas agarici]NWC09797.1 LysR family transcriptional regulator [Pseudomonas agarici]
MNLRQLEVFHAIMRTGSVTAAARQLNVSQPAISAVLRHCESQLGMPLFLRTGARLIPTPEAQAILPDVAGIFDRLAAVDRLIRDLNGGIQGTLTLAGSFPVTNGVLAQAAASFMAERPETRIALYSGSSPVVLQQVANREVDVGIAYGPIVHNEVETELLFSSSIACVMPDDHPLATRSAIKISDLMPYPVITYLNQSPMRSYVDRALSEAGVFPNIRSQVSLSLSGMMLAKFGAGIALVEPFLLSVMGIPGLVARPFNPCIEVRTLILRHHDAPRSRLLEDFLAHLKIQCAEFGEAPMLHPVETGCK